MSGINRTVYVTQPMRFDPAFATPKPYPSEPNQYRDHHGKLAWLFNPYTGEPRHPADIGSDPFGELIAMVCIKFPA